MAKFRRNPVRRGQGGFTLIEVLVAMALITIISFVVIGSVGPWLALKQNIDNDRKLVEVRSAITSMYEANAMAAERQGSGVFFSFANSTIDAAGNCNNQQAAFLTLKTLMSDSGAQGARDGYGNPWCVFISGQLATTRDGATLYYRNIALVSAGRDNALAGTTRMDASGTMTYAGDDVGVMVSGYDVQYPKLQETIRRLSRISNVYETYFSTRFMSYADRDITRNYFSTAWDSTGSVATTGDFTAAVSLLGGIGVSSSDAYTPWEADNAITVGNNAESVNGQTVRSPNTTGTGALPYTALLRAQLPSPAGTTVYLSRVAVGNY